MSQPQTKSFLLTAKIDPHDPELLGALDYWLRLGLIDHDQVKVLAATCLTSPVALADPQVAPSPPPPVIPTVLETAWQGFRDELSVRWLLFLGVFLTILSSGVLAASQWQNFPAWGQYGVLWLYTIAFGGIGRWASRQEHLRLTAGTLQTVTLLLVPIHGWAIDALGLWQSPGGIAVALVGIATLGGISWQAQRQGSLPTNLVWAQGILAICHGGWAFSPWSIAATYIATLTTAFVLQPRSRHRSSGQLLLFYSLALVLFRAIWIAQLSIVHLGLAIGMAGWILLQQGLAARARMVRLEPLVGKSPRRQKYSSGQRYLSAWYQQSGLFLVAIGGFLGCYSWLWYPARNSPWQGAILAILLALWCGQRLGQKTLRRDLYGLFILGFGAYSLIGASWQPYSGLAVRTQLARWGVGEFDGLLLGVLPYLVAWVTLTAWWWHRQRQRWVVLGEEVLWLAMGGMLLLSADRPLARFASWVTVAAIAGYIGQRRRPLIGWDVDLTHGLVLGAIGMGVLWQWRPWSGWLAGSLGLGYATHWPGATIGLVGLILALGEWLVAGRPVFAAPAPSTGQNSFGQRWLISSRYFGLGLAAMSYGGWWLLDPLAAARPWALLWLVVPIALTVTAYRGPLAMQEWAAGLSSLGLVLVQPLGFARSDGYWWTVGVAIGLMGWNSLRLVRPWAAIEHLGLMLLGAGLLARNGQLLAGQGGWVAIAVAAIALAVVAQRLSAQTNSLANCYGLAAGTWAQILSLVGIGGAVANYALTYLSGVPALGFGHTPMLLVALVLGLGGWLVVDRRRPGGMGKISIQVLAQLILGAIVALAGGDGWTLAAIDSALAVVIFGGGVAITRRGGTLPTLWGYLPLIYALGAIALRWPFFHGGTGLTTLVAGVILLLGYQRWPQTGWVYAGFGGILLGVYELLTYPMIQAPAGGSAADALTIYALGTAGLALTYRVLVWWWARRGADTLWGLTLPQVKRVAHVHWAGASLGQMGAAAVPVVPVPQLTLWYLAVSGLLGLYALIQGRDRSTPRQEEWWVYLGVVQLIGTGVYARSRLGAWAPWDEYWILLACGAGIVLLLCPWSRWGWYEVPWQRVALVLPLVRVLGSWPQISLVQLGVLALFYGGAAKRQHQFGWAYLALIFLDWLLWRLLVQWGWYDALTAVLVGGGSLLVAAEWDPYLRRVDRRHYRHYVRLLACGAIAVVAMVGYQDRFWLPLAISLGLALWGLGCRVRAGLYVGTITLVLNCTYQLLVLVAEQSFLKWVLGLLVGVLIIAIGANFEGRRSQMTAAWHHWLAQLHGWQ